MSIFSSVVHLISSPIQHLIGKTATNILLPAIPISQFASRAGDSIVNKVTSGLFNPQHVSQVPIQQRNPALTLVPSMSTQPYYPQQSSQPYFGSGGGYAPSYPDPQSYLGGPSWGYSTVPTTFSPAYTPTYSAAPVQQPNNRIWEDIASLALPYFL